MRSPLRDIQRRYGRGIDGEIKRWTEIPHAEIGFWGMLQYQLGYVNERFVPERSTSAKRFRPALCLLACEAVGGNPHAALGVAAAIELLHNFSLIHDDIEDRDPARRHRPTVWKVWGEPRAVNAGDAMFALSGRIILDAAEDARTALLLAREFQQTCLELTEGQYLDMSFERRQDVSPDEYLEMISLKTGALVAFSLWSGALLGGARQPVRDALRRFGLEMGRAFQIWDDIMGIWGAEERTGKQAATDLLNRKKTLPVLIAQEHAGGEAARLLREFLSGRLRDIDPVLEILEETRARVLSEDRLERYLCAAVEALSDSSLAISEQERFTDLARELSGQSAASS